MLVGPGYCRFFLLKIDEVCGFRFRCGDLDWFATSTTAAKANERHRGAETGDTTTNATDISCGELSGGLGHLPSKEAMASKGLEAKVDMATHGHQSWALMSLGSWRTNSLRSSGQEGESAAFIKSRQREARRAMLGSSKSNNSSTGAAEATPAGGGGYAVAERRILETVPAKPPRGERSHDMDVG